MEVTTPVTPVVRNVATSVLLTQFSLKEWRLTSQISKILHEFPEIHSRNDGKKLLEMFGMVEQVLEELCSSCLESLEQTQPVVNQPDEEQCKSIKYLAEDIKQKSHQLQLILETYGGNKLIEELIQLSVDANDLLEVTANLLKKNRATVFINTNSEQINENFLETISTETIAKLDPDGEGLANPIESGAEVSCHRCNQMISKQSQGIRFARKSFHKSCFLCVSCQKPVESSAFLTYDSAPLCQSCTVSCTVCRKPIMFECFVALEQTFHLDCFKCVECNQNIRPDDTFYHKKTKPICSNCITKSVNQGLKASEPVPPPRLHTPKKIIPLDSKIVKVLENAPVPPKRKTSIDNLEEEMMKRLNLPAPIRFEKNVKSLKQLSQDLANKYCMLQVSEKNVTLQSIFDKSYYTDLFLKFCIQENLCSEKALFYADVESFKSSCAHNPDNAVSIAEVIYNKYMQEGSDMWIVSLKLNEIEKFGYQIKDNSVNLDLFDTIQRQIYNELETEVLPVFLKSSYGYKFLASKEIGEKPTEEYLSGAFAQTRSRYEPLDIVSANVIAMEKRYFPKKHCLYSIRLVRQFEKNTQLYPDFTPSKREVDGGIIRRTDSDLKEFCSVLISLFPKYSKLIYEYSFKKQDSIWRNIAFIRSRRYIIDEIDNALNDLLNLPDEIRTCQVFRAFMKASDTDLKYVLK